jgi:hypothetical protein
VENQLPRVHASFVKLLQEELLPERAASNIAKIGRDLILSRIHQGSGAVESLSVAREADLRAALRNRSRFSRSLLMVGRRGLAIFHMVLRGDILHIPVKDHSRIRILLPESSGRTLVITSHKVKFARSCTYNTWSSQIHALSGLTKSRDRLT